MSEKIVLVDGARTPLASFGGVFKDVPGYELGAAATNAALERVAVAAEAVQEVVMSCVRQVGRDVYNVGRLAIAAGLPDTVPAQTVNRLCGSGLQAIWSAAMQMRCNDLDITVAGGNESMSRMPFYDISARSGYGLGDRALVDGTVIILTDPFHGIHMGITAENVATKDSVSRREQQAFAAESQRRAATPAAQAAFTEEIVAVGTVTEDEHHRPATTLDKLARLSPAFQPNGTLPASLRHQRRGRRRSLGHRDSSAPTQSTPLLIKL